MPTNQPNNAAEEKVELRDDATAAAVIADEQLDDAPSGGGLGGASAAVPLQGSGRTPDGSSPNSPIDVPTPPHEGDATRDSQIETADTAPEPTRTSR